MLGGFCRRRVRVKVSKYDQQKGETIEDDEGVMRPSCEKKSEAEQSAQKKKKIDLPSDTVACESKRTQPSLPVFQVVAKRGCLFCFFTKLQQNQQDRRQTDSRRLFSTTPGRTTAYHTYRHLLERRMLILINRPASCSIVISFNTRFLQHAYSSVSAAHYFSRQFPRSFFENAPPYHTTINRTAATAISALDIRISTHHNQSAVFFSGTPIHQLAVTPVICASRPGHLKRAFSSVTSRSPRTPVSKRMSVSNIPRTLEIRLTEQEQKICEVLDAVSKRYEEKESKMVQLRIAGGWVRDKVWTSDMNCYF